MGGWTRGRKTVAVSRHHRVHCPAAAPSFVPPELPDGVEFDRYDLILSIGRNLAMKVASRSLIRALAAGRSPLLKHLVDNIDAPLRLSGEVASLGDAALTSLSHDIGVGVAGLHMEAMGFVWRANGKEVLSQGERYPDYVWDSGVAGGGVVLSEAKGSAAIGGTFNGVEARARDGMFEQVEPRIGTKTMDYQDIVSGYAFGIFAAGGEDCRTAAYEAMNFAGSPRSGPGTSPSPAILQSHFGGVLRLLGIDDDDENAAELLEGQVRFSVYGDEVNQFVVPAATRSSSISPMMFDPSTFPALSLPVAARALNLRFGIPDASREKASRWPRFERRREKLPRGVLAIAPDGLALVGPRWRQWPPVVWKPGDGFQPLG